MRKIKPEHLLFAATILITLIGISSLFSACSEQGILVRRDIFFKQLCWIALGGVCLVISSRISYQYLFNLSYFLYGLAVSFLIAVLILGPARLGAQRWIPFGEINLQPSELAKLATILILARYLSRRIPGNLASSSLRPKEITVSFLFLFLPAILIFLQPDLGTASLFPLLFFALLLLAEIKLRTFFKLVAFSLISLPFLWCLLRDYQKERLLVFLNPNLDPLGAGYTVIQSKIAIGGGGILGKGWLGGTQSQLNFLPECHTDFIFSVVGEEWGLLGASFVVLAYFILVYNGLRIAKQTKDSFGSLIAAGISILLGFQIFINIAMTLGFCPVVGLPLPFMSYGGSSMVSSFFLIGILISISRRRIVF